ncbi:MAG: hypothetical protein VX574_06180 [Myxococcota bacterium]|nr:hypothetical protein [Myxococcota bacterium]
MSDPPDALDRAGNPNPGVGAWVVAALMLFAAGVRVVAWFQKAVLFDDGPLFLAMADAIRDGDWAAVLGHDYHPLY